jgi:hypothetical protein
MGADLGIEAGQCSNLQQSINVDGCHHRDDDHIRQNQSPENREAHDGASSPVNRTRTRAIGSAG